MITNNTLPINHYRWIELPTGYQVIFYRDSDEKILIYRRKFIDYKDGKSYTGYYYGLREDDCRHTKKFVYNSIRHYLYVKEILGYEN